VPFFVGTERYYEVALQLANLYATINIWDIKSKIKVVINWKVSIEPRCLNKLGEILKVQTKLNSKYREYIELMNYLDLIDLQEFDSVKVIIPKSNSEKITHGIFYTAITRAKKYLKIYWSSETMTDIVKSFSEDESGRKSLKIVKEKLNK
jgi:hypothetical protein